MKYLAFSKADYEYQQCDTIEEARSWLSNTYEDGIPGEAQHDCIYELKEVVQFTETDRKENYKYTDYYDLQEGEDDEYVWPYDNEFDIIYDIAFVPYMEEVKK
mgnify:FL=1